LKEIALRTLGERAGNSVPVLARRGCDQHFETSLQMRLIGESRGVCHFRYWPAATKLRSAEFNTAIGQVGMRRQSVFIFERSYQIGRRQISRGTNLFQLEGARVIVSYELRGALEAAMPMPRQVRRRTQCLLYFSHECQCRAVLLQSLGSLIGEDVVEATQPDVQFGLCGEGCR